MWWLDIVCYERFVAGLESTEFRSHFNVMEIPRFLVQGVSNFIREMKKLRANQDPSSANSSGSTSADGSYTGPAIEFVVTDVAQRLDKSLYDSLLPHQLQGVEFIVQRGGRGLIGDEMGCGKTITAIAIMQYYRNHWPALVLVPVGLVAQWKESLIKFANLREKDIGVLTTGKGANAACFGQVTIVAYTMLEKFVANGKISPNQFGVVVADESHNLKNKDAKRTQVALPVLKNASCALCLTGTPSLNRPEELFTQIHAVAPYVFNDYEAFTRRFCDAKPSRFSNKMDVTGASNEAELKLLLDSMVMIRRLKSEVLTTLGTKNRVLCWVIPDPAKMPQINACKQQHKALENQIRNSMDEQEQRDLKVQLRALGTREHSLAGESKVKKVLVEIRRLIEEAATARLGVIEERKQALKVESTAADTDVPVIELLDDESQEPEFVALSTMKQELPQGTEWEEPASLPASQPTRKYAPLANFPSFRDGQLSDVSADEEEDEEAEDDDSDGEVYIPLVPSAASAAAPTSLPVNAPTIGSGAGPTEAALMTLEDDGGIFGGSDAEVEIVSAKPAAEKAVVEVGLDGPDGLVDTESEEEPVSRRSTRLSKSLGGVGSKLSKGKGRKALWSESEDESEDLPARAVGTRTGTRSSGRLSVQEAICLDSDDDDDDEEEEDDDDEMFFDNMFAEKRSAHPKRRCTSSKGGGNSATKRMKQVPETEPVKPNGPEEIKAWNDLLSHKGSGSLLDDDDVTDFPEVAQGTKGKGKSKGKRKKAIIGEGASPAKPRGVEYHAGRKIIVFAHHLAVLDALDAGLREMGEAFIRIDGSTSKPMRNSGLQRFSEDDTTNVALLSITAAGTGLNLTRANVLLFAELDWSPGQLLQCEDRIHRIGQSAHEVNIIYMVAKGTQDEVVWSLVQSKHTTINNTVGLCDAKESRERVAKGGSGGASNSSGSMRIHSNSGKSDNDKERVRTNPVGVGNGLNTAGFVSKPIGAQSTMLGFLVEKPSCPPVAAPTTIASRDTYDAYPVITNSIPQAVPAATASKSTSGSAPCAPVPFSYLLSADSSNSLQGTHVVSQDHHSRPQQQYPPAQQTYGQPKPAFVPASAGPPALPASYTAAAVSKPAPTETTKLPAYYSAAALTTNSTCALPASYAAATNVSRRPVVISPIYGDIKSSSVVSRLQGVPVPQAQAHHMQAPAAPRGPTPQQLEQIERNRQQALERLRLNKLKQAQATTAGSSGTGQAPANGHYPPSSGMSGTHPYNGAVNVPSTAPKPTPVPAANPPPAPIRAPIDPRVLAQIEENRRRAQELLRAKRAAATVPAAPTGGVHGVPVPCAPSLSLPMGSSGTHFKSGTGKSVASVSSQAIQNMSQMFSDT